MQTMTPNISICPVLFIFATAYKYSAAGLFLVLQEYTRLPNNCIYITFQAKMNFFYNPGSKFLGEL